ncbi:GFA family protein [Seongchinamella sediminis]|uniref:GFA family protein n=1 Tax=Seongchinamella sediminis TaxID=2283635 RepID=A0A3L7DYA5_9GAMM|nr:GFA family protein [Seongchinamella sediminis]RLQ20842.1 GFA family protein [Seongchinamella sediminis]
MSDQYGGCACGAVRYVVTGKALSVHACHCTDCQSLSGSAFGMSMVLNRSDIELTRGELMINDFTASRNRMHRHSCCNCGVALWFSSPGHADIVALKPGTLDDTSSLQPIAHVWFRSAQPWLRVGDDVAVFQEQPEFDELLALAQKAGLG